MVLVNSKGDYVTEEVAPRGNDETKELSTQELKKTATWFNQSKKRNWLKWWINCPFIRVAMTALPRILLTNLSKDMIQEFNKGQSKAFVMVEYIIDQTGKPVYAKVLRGGNDEYE